jgi:hypothetical protein
LPPFAIKDTRLGDVDQLRFEPRSTDSTLVFCLCSLKHSAVFGRNHQADQSLVLFIFSYMLCQTQTSICKIRSNYCNFEVIISWKLKNAS